MESTNFEITYPINKKYRYIISMGLFSVSLFLFSFVFLIQIIFNYMFFEFEKFLIVIGGLLVSFVFFNVFFWFSFGVEKIIISDGKFTYLKSNKILKLKTDFTIEEIVKIRRNNRFLERNLLKSIIEKRVEIIQEYQRAFPFWYDMGKIEIITKNKNFTIFNGLEISSIDMIIDDLNNALKNK